VARTGRGQHHCAERYSLRSRQGHYRAVRVKLQNGGAVEGDIFHRSLSIDENSQFEDRRGGLRIQRSHR